MPYCETTLLNGKCSVNGCKKKFHARNFCNTHYQRVRKYGDPLKFINMRSETGLCSLPDCNRPYQGKGYCRQHYEIYITTDQDRHKNRKRIKNKNHERRKLLMILLGGMKCKKCGFEDYRALQIDHKKGNGKKQRERFNGQIDMYIYYLVHEKEARKDLQVLCANCNWIKRHTNKELRTIKTMRKYNGN